MHKITKGLKKKKKGKKSKHKEEELFKPEELEAYRREHQQIPATSEVVSADTAAPPTANDEWKKFNALTAGIDSFLKKTQDDLDRIKSTSFFQRVPTASEVKKEQEETAEEHSEQNTVENVKEAATAETGIVLVSESESEEEDEEDIFDTSYIDVIAAGEVKLAYIPESPTEQPEGDDPFDTTIAERAILGPAVTRKGKKLVPLGAAVEVLTGRVQAPTCVPIKRPSTRRTVLKERDLLLGSFDDNANTIADNKRDSPPDNKPSLLDDDTFLPNSDEPIDLSKTLHQIVPTPVTEKLSTAEDSSKNILEEFDVIIKAENLPEDEDDKEFALLAAESLSKTQAVAILPTNAANQTVEDTWQAFEEFSSKPQANIVQNEEIGVEDDPFDTTFAENVVPGKCELKIIENEILSSENDLDFNPRAEDKLNELIKNKVSIQVTNPAGQKNSLEKISESELNTIQPQHRDLLGGSITDLSSLGDQPLQPKEKVDENYIEYCDPFDTTIVETATNPGQTELKFLEKELLSDIHPACASELSDDDFDPRAEESQEQQYNRKTSTASLKAVNFTLPITELGGDLFAVGEENSKKVSKPLTPYYVRENSLPEHPLDEEDLENADPFDTSFVATIGPGKAELKVIESELFQPESSLKHSISDQDFNPRDEKQVAVAKVVQTIKEISNPANLNKPKVLSFNEPKEIDLLAVDNDVTAKVLTPAAEKSLDLDEISYVDPFDTSIASNILPGKAELKLLETELIHSTSGLKRVLTDPDFDPRDSADAKVLHKTTQQTENKNVPDLLEHTADTVTTKPLTPVVGSKVNFEIGDDDEDIDPFDTSIANNIGPGQTELKLLESELI